jgi:hypothetical protein
MKDYHETRETMLPDYQRELVRKLRNSHLQLIQRPAGDPSPAPVILRLYWQLADDGSRPRVRAAWFR